MRYHIRLNPFFIRASFQRRKEMIRIASESQSLLYQGFVSTYRPDWLYMGLTGLNPFFIRASFQRLVDAGLASFEPSQSLLYQGFVSTGRTVISRPNRRRLNPFFIRASCPPGYRSREVASQSLLYQGFVSTSNPSGLQPGRWESGCLNPFFIRASFQRAAL